MGDAFRRREGGRESSEKGARELWEKSEKRMKERWDKRGSRVGVGGIRVRERQKKRGRGVREVWEGCQGGVEGWCYKDER